MDKLRKIILPLQIVSILVVSVLLALGMNRLRPEPLPMAYSISAQDNATGLSEIDGQSLVKIANDADTRLVDARDALEFGMGHIPGAINIPSSTEGKELELKVSDLPKDATIIVYCDGLACGKSRAVGEKLLKLGLHNVRIYPDGIDGWLNLGMDLEVQ